MSITHIGGCDCSGKSSIVEKLSNQLDYPTRHFDKPKDMEDGKKQYFDFINQLELNQNIIADRLHDGEWIYAPLYRGYTGNYLREFEREVINKHSYLFVHMKASLETIITRANSRGEDFVKEEHFQSVLDLYEEYVQNQAMPFIEIDTTNSKTEDDVKRIIEAYNNSKLIWELVKNGTCTDAILKPVQPRGNIEADIMVIAQNPGGKGNCEYSTIWSEGKNSNFILETTKEAGIFKNTWFTNLVPYPTEDNKVTKQQIEETEHIIFAQVELIKPKVLIALGNVVSENLKRIFGEDLPIIETQHPSYVTRFLSGDKEALAKYTSTFAKANDYLKG